MFNEKYSRLKVFSIMSFLLLSACSKPESLCSSEIAVGQTRDILSKRAVQHLLNLDPIFDEANVRAKLGTTSLSVENIRTTKNDPHSTKVFCEGILSITTSYEVLNVANQVRKALNLGNIQETAKDLSFEQNATSFTKSIEYSVQPTDDGKHIVTEVSAVDSFSILLGEIVGYSSLGESNYHQKAKEPTSLDNHDIQRCIDTKLAKWSEEREREIHEWCEELAKNGEECRTTVGGEAILEEEALADFTKQCTQ